MLIIAWPIERLLVPPTGMVCAYPKLKIAQYDKGVANMKISVPIDFILPYADEWESIGERERAERESAADKREQLEIPLPTPEIDEEREVTSNDVADPSEGERGVLTLWFYDEEL